MDQDCGLCGTSGQIDKAPPKSEFPDTADGRLVKALCDIEDGVNKWEIDFTNSVANQVIDGRSLSGRQIEVIEGILER